MKINSVIRLASKNLYENFSRSIWTLVSITLLSIVIITLSNMSYYYNKNIKAIILEHIQENGVEVSIQPKDKDEYLKKEDIEEFVEKVKEFDAFHEYEIHTRTGVEKGNFTDENFIDYNMAITQLIFYDKVSNYQDISIAKKLFKLREMDNKYCEIYGITISMYHEYLLLTAFVTGVSMFLTILCILLSMGSLLNTLKISITKNSQSIGIIKALGTRNKSICQYILVQVGILIIIATFISTLLSWIIAKFTLKQQIETVMFAVGEFESNNIIVGYNLLIPLINVVILAASVVLGSIKMLRKYFKKEPIEIIREAE